MSAEKRPDFPAVKRLKEYAAVMPELDLAGFPVPIVSAWEKFQMLAADGQVGGTRIALKDLYEVTLKTVILTGAACTYRDPAQQTPAHSQFLRALFIKSPSFGHWRQDIALALLSLLKSETAPTSELGAVTGILEDLLSIMEKFQIVTWRNQDAHGAAHDLRDEDAVDSMINKWTPLAAHWACMGDLYRALPFGRREMYPFAFCEEENWYFFDSFLPAKHHLLFLCYRNNQRQKRGFLLSSIVPETAPDTTKNLQLVDVHSELSATFDHLFGEDAPPREKPSDTSSFDEEDALDLLNYQVQEALVEVLAGVEPEDTPESTASEPAFSMEEDHFSDGGDAPDEDDAPAGKYFSISNPSGTYTTCYRVDRAALPELRKWHYLPTQLDCAIERREDGSILQTFFIENPDINGNPLLKLDFVCDGPDKPANMVYVNMGFLDYDVVKFSLKPTAMKFSAPFQPKPSLPEALKNTFSFDKKDLETPEKEEKEFAYTYNPERIFIILDPDNCEEIKPKLRLVDGELKGFMNLVPYKKYFTFEIRSKDDPTTSNDMSDYDIGHAYRHGRMMLTRDYKKAIPYLKTAAAAGEARALRELAGMYEQGLGCLKNEARAQRMRELADKIDAAE